MYVYSPVLFHTLRLAGLLPVSVQKLPLRRQIITYSYPLVYYAAFLIVLFTGSIAAWIWISFFTEESQQPAHWTNKYSDVSVLTTVCSSLLGYLTACALVLLSTTRIKRKIKLMEMLSEVDFQLQRVQSGQQNHLQSYLVVLYAIVLLIIDSWTSGGSGISYHTVFTSFKVIALCGVIDFAEVVLCIKDRFQLVNERVVEVTLRKSQECMWTVTLPFVEFAVPQDKTISIALLSDAHLQLCSLVRYVNSLYGPQLGFTMVYIFSYLVYYPYFIFLIFPDTQIPLMYKLVIAGWLLLFVVQLFVMTRPCSLTVTEVKRTVAVVSKLMGNKMSKQGFQELESFSQQLFNRDVEFSACGLCTLDSSIIISVGSAVTTYMAIFLQFQNTEKSSVPPTNNKTATSNKTI